jgi:alpha-galactosidase
MKPGLVFIVFICSLFFVSCNKSTRISSGNLELEINGHMETRISSLSPRAKPLMNSFVPSEYLSCEEFDAKQFKSNRSARENFSDNRGTGYRIILKGKFRMDSYSIEKILNLTVYDSFPDMVFVKVSYVNFSTRDISVIKWVNNAYPVLNSGDTPAFWSFQGSSTNERKDWILRVDSSFFQKNYMGMNNTDYGGGIPVIDLWRKDAGIAVGHVEPKPCLVSLPVEKNKYEDWARISVVYEFSEPYLLLPGDTLETLTTFVSVHSGDCYASLQEYSRFMQASGIKFAPHEPEAYEAVWCSWGYEQRFTLAEITGTLPKVKELGFKWVDLDYGYQQAIGDWDVDPDKFPHRNADMRKLVDQIHSMGLKAKLWWSPLAVHPCSKLFKKNPDIILQNSDGSPQFITFWDSYFMSPVYNKTIDHTKETLKMFLKDWDFDGLKMDGMHLNCVPPDYNPWHELKYPEQACENLPAFFRMIYETATLYKPHAVLQICPCGDAMSFFNMPFTNQTVASDPASSWQIRLKNKTYKALLGNVAY